MGIKAQDLQKPVQKNWFFGPLQSFTLWEEEGTKKTLSLFWDLISEKLESLLCVSDVVRGEGLEPSSLLGHNILSVACIPIPPSALIYGFLLCAWALNYDNSDIKYAGF